MKCPQLPRGAGDVRGAESALPNRLLDSESAGGQGPDRRREAAPGTPNRDLMPGVGEPGEPGGPGSTGREECRTQDMEDGREASPGPGVPRSGRAGLSGRGVTWLLLVLTWGGNSWDQEPLPEPPWQEQEERAKKCPARLLLRSGVLVLPWATPAVRGGRGVRLGAEHRPRRERGRGSPAQLWAKSVTPGKWLLACSRR